MCVCRSQPGGESLCRTKGRNQKQAGAPHSNVGLVHRRGGGGWRRKSFRGHCGAGRHVSGLIGHLQVQVSSHRRPPSSSHGPRRVSWRCFIAGGLQPKRSMASVHADGGPRGQQPVLRNRFLAMGCPEGALASAPLWPPPLTTLKAHHRSLPGTKGVKHVALK